MKPIVFLKSVSKKYANDFENGVVHFSKPIEWVREEIKGNKGQGDIAEGIIGFKDNIHVRRKNILNNYCFCTYALKDLDFTKESIDGSGEPGKEYLVKKKYFDDFDKLRKDNNFIYVLKPQMFMDKLIDSLMTLGIKKGNIIYDFINYIPINFLNNKILNIPYPNELLIKDISFHYQSEYRIVINCDKESLDILQNTNGNILLNKMNECIIAKLDSYNKDMMLFLENETNALLYSLPKEKVTDISKYLEGYNKWDLASLEFNFLFAAEPFFYYDDWLIKLDETIAKVKECYGYLFDITIFGLIDLITNSVVTYMDRNYYYGKLMQKAKNHFNKKHYETAYNIYLEAKYISCTNELDDKIADCKKFISINA